MTAVSQTANESSPHHGEALWHLLSQTDAGQTVTTGASESCSVAGSSSGQQILAAAATTLTPVTGSLQSPANQVCAPDAGSMPSQQGESTANSSATVTPTATAAQTQSQADWWHGSHPAETSQLATEASVSAAFGSSEPSAIAGNPNCPQTAPVLASATIPEPASPQTTADQVSAPTAGVSLSATSADGSPTGITGTPSTVQTTPAGVLSQVPDTEQASSATMTPNLSFSVPHSIVYQDAGPGVSPQLASILHQHLASIQPNAIESPLDNYTGGDALSWTPTPEFEQANVPHVHAPETFPVHGDTLATDHAASAHYHFDAHG